MDYRRLGKYAHPLTAFLWGDKRRQISATTLPLHIPRSEKRKVARVSLAGSGEISRVRPSPYSHVVTDGGPALAPNALLPHDRCSGVYIFIGFRLDAALRGTETGERIAPTYFPREHISICYAYVMHMLYVYARRRNAKIRLVLAYAGRK